MYFFNMNETRCDVFTYTCGRHGNKFRNVDDCLTTCTGYSPQLSDRMEIDAERTEQEESDDAWRPNHGRRPYRVNG